MSDWLHDLSIGWMALVVIAGTYVCAALICLVIARLATGERVRTFRAVSSALLSPMGTLFALLVAFMAAQVWSDIDQAETAVSREASALRTVVLLAAAFPQAPQAHLTDLVRRHIEHAVNNEWPRMASQTASLSDISTPLFEALQFTVTLAPAGEGQIDAQREIVAAIEAALDARRQRIIGSHSSVNWVKWLCLFAQGAATLIIIAMTHCENRAASAIATGLFATAVALSILLILAHDRPFSGQISVKPDLLLQVLPPGGRRPAGADDDAVHPGLRAPVH
jgi:hypothetical protein